MDIYGNDDWDDWLWADYVTDGGLLGIFAPLSTNKRRTRKQNSASPTPPPAFTQEEKEKAVRHYRHAIKERKYLDAAATRWNFGLSGNELAAAEMEPEYHDIKREMADGFMDLFSIIGNIIIALISD